MKELKRPYRWFGAFALLGLGALGLTPSPGSAQAMQMAPLRVGAVPLMAASAGGVQGYLGVDLADVDNDKAQALKLKDARGAVITLIDHDAPAGQVGLRVNDVVLRMNGQTVDDAEQLRRLLREVPPGRRITLTVSRDGSEQMFSVALADRQVMEQSIWNRIIGRKDDSAQPAPAMGLLAGGSSSVPSGGGFHLPFFGSNLNVGVLVEPLTAQMATVLGIPSGLMVKQVATKSAAEAAGLQAFDVILKVGTESMATLASWDRALRANQGKTVPVTILRDKKPQTLTLLVDSKHKQSELRHENVGPSISQAKGAES
jgi:S1-C subfamily serine protease